MSRRRERIHLCHASPFEGLERKAVLYARGPSLDGHDFGKDHGLRIAINEAVLVVPCLWGFCWDYAPLLRIGKVVRAHGVDPALGPPWMVVPEDLFFGDDETAWVRTKGWYFRRDDVKAWRPGTAPVVLAMLGQAGYQEVKLVGFDAYWHPEILDKPPVDLVVPVGDTGPLARRSSEAVGRWVREYPGPDKPADNWQANYREINRVISRTAGDFGIRLVAP